MTTAKDRIVRLGNVSNNYSNFLSFLAIDAAHAPAWTGSEGEDFDRATALRDEGESLIEVGEGVGALCDVGGCGTADFFRVDGDRLVTVEHYSDDWDAALEADFLRTIVTLPTSEEVEPCGTIDVTSGVLALVSALEPVPPIEPAALAAARATGVESTDWGLLVAVPPGAYTLYHEEDLEEARGGWGLVTGRVRIVPKDTPVEVGAPIVVLEAAAPAAEVERIAPAEVLRVDPWEAVESFAVDEKTGMTVVGELGGARLRAFDASGKMAWETVLAEAEPDVARYSRTVGVAIAPSRVVATYRSTRFVVDLSTGRVLEKTEIDGLRGILLSPDGRWEVRHIGTRAHVVWSDLPDRPIELPHYWNGYGLISSDSRLLVLSGHRTHVIELGPMTVLASTKDESGEIALSPDGEVLAIASNDGRVRFVDATSLRPTFELDIAPAQQVKPSVCAVTFDASGRFLATASEDGAVRVWALPTKELVHDLGKHETKIPGTGARRLSQVAFAGSRLLVSSGRVTEPVAVNAYPIQGSGVPDNRRAATGEVRRPEYPPEPTTQRSPEPTPRAPGAPPRPSDLPAEATWNEEDGEWELGARRDGTKLGVWTWWRPAGSLLCKSTYDAAGELHGTCRRFHPDGTISLESHYVHGVRWGKTRHTRSLDGRSPEDGAMAPLPDAVFEFAIAYFDGEALPFSAALTRAGVEAPPKSRVGCLVDFAGDMRKYAPGTAMFAVGTVVDIAKRRFDVRVLYFDGFADEDETMLRFSFQAPGERTGKKPAWQDPDAGTVLPAKEVRRSLVIAADYAGALFAHGRPPPEPGFIVEPEGDAIRIRKVDPTAAGAKAGLAVDDIVVAIDGRPIRGLADYLEGRALLAEQRHARFDIKRGEAIVAIQLDFT